MSPYRIDPKHTSPSKLELTWARFKHFNSWMLDTVIEHGWKPVFFVFGWALILVCTLSVMWCVFPGCTRLGYFVVVHMSDPRCVIPYDQVVDDRAVPFWIVGAVVSLIAFLIFRFTSLWKVFE